MKLAACWIVPTIALLSPAGNVLAEPPQTVRFNEHVRPILAANCFACHGFDAKQRKADLRLDDPKNALGERDGYLIIKPGDPDESELWLRIIMDDPDAVMPPPSSKKTLTEDQKAIIRRWIEQGAVYQKHWAFEAPAKAQAPAVQNEKWARNDVDRFILARLEREGLAPQPEADKPTLIRRVAFALTGLPPTPAEVDLFLNDDGPAAYERMVDRYLESPHFGEEFARHWLDVARYADTHGLHLDNEREMWAYRDWVVQAFNDNLPFDQFTTWQIAGDLLPNPTREQTIATGFNRCNVTTGEGGSIAEELLYRYAIDRTSTTIQTWMGLTAGCAQCHDHKYDPLTQKEFYSLYAFFNSAADPAMDGHAVDTPPFLKMPTKEQESELGAARRNETDIRTRIEAAVAKATFADPSEEKVAVPLRTVADEIFDDAFPFGVTGKNSTRTDPTWALDPAFDAKSGRRVLQMDYDGTLRVTLSFPLRPLVAPYAGRIEGWLRVDAKRPPSSLTVQVNGGKDKHLAVWGGTAKREKSSDRLEMGLLPPGDQWVHIVVPLDGIGIEPGTVIKSMVLSENGGRLWLDSMQLVGESDPATDPLSSFAVWWRESDDKNLGSLTDELKEFSKEAIAAIKAGPDKEHSDEIRDDLRRLYLTQVQRESESPAAELRREIGQSRVARIILEDQVIGTFVYRDLPKPRDSFVMLRGQYDKPGEPVAPGTPAAFPALDMSDSAQRATRLDLARWLLSPEHPLTARVAVNRYWQQLFGVGLVKTSDDFGTQGEPPSHPDLLDWLAVQFMAPATPPLCKGGQGGVASVENSATLERQATPPLPRGGNEHRTSNIERRRTSPAKINPQSAIRNPQSPSPPPNPPFLRGGETGAWDVKSLVRLLVTSATFRQQSRVSPEVLERDPQNRLYARGPRFRLDAEQVRDNALYVSGLINLKMGGRGVQPYQPPNIWEPVGYADSNTRYYVQDHGADLYRRSLYCFLKRTAPAPFMANFDGPSREQFCTRRERSDTPLQALQLMNDVQHFEAARALAERTLSEAGPTDDERIAFLYRIVLARHPDQTERQIVYDFLSTERSLFNSDRKAARKAVHVGESTPRAIAPDGETAAWTLVANMLLNLDETVTRN